jgi:hypothetical protein
VLGRLIKDLPDESDVELFAVREGIITEIGSGDDNNDERQHDAERGRGLQPSFIYFALPLAAGAAGRSVASAGCRRRRAAV